MPTKRDETPGEPAWTDARNGAGQPRGNAGQISPPAPSRYPTAVRRNSPSPVAQRCLLDGVDELGYILQREPAIAAYEAARAGRV